MKWIDRHLSNERVQMAKWIHEEKVQYLIPLGKTKQHYADANLTSVSARKQKKIVYENVTQKELLCTILIHYGNQDRCSSKKWKIELPYDQAVPLLGV